MIEQSSTEQKLHDNIFGVLADEAENIQNITEEESDNSMCLGHA